MAKSSVALILRKSVSGGSIKLLQAIFGLLVSMLLARQLGVEEFGVYAFLLAIVTLLAMPASEGMAQLLVREVAQGLAARDWPLVRGVLVWGGGVTAVYALVAGAGLIGGWAVFGDLTATPPAAILSAAGLLFLLAIIGGLSGAARGLKNIVLGVLPAGVIMPVGLASIFALMIWGAGLPLLAPTALTSHALGALLACSVAAVGLWRILPAEVRSGRDLIVRARPWLFALLPLAALGGLQTVNRQIDLIMLGVLGSNSDVAIYRVAVQGGMLLGFGLQVVNITIAPYCAELMPSKGRAQLQRLLNLGSFLALSVTVPGVLIFALFGEPLLRLMFGPEFAAAYYPLVILSAGKLINAAAGPLTVLLNMAGHERTTMVSFVSVVALNIFLNLVLITFFGAVGAAVASTIALFYWSATRAVAARKLLGIFPFRRPE